MFQLLASILTGLRAAVAQVSPRGRARSPAAAPPCDPIDHMFACFERLYADWRNGTLPEPCAGTGLPDAATARPSRRILPGPALTAPRASEPATSCARSAQRPASPSRRRMRSPAQQSGEAIIPPKKSARLDFDSRAPISFRLFTHYAIFPTH